MQKFLTKNSSGIKNRQMFGKTANSTSRRYESANVSQDHDTSAMNLDIQGATGGFGGAIDAEVE